MMVSIPRSMLILLGRFLGFTLLFVGTLVAVAAASATGGCWTSTGSCNASWMGGVANSILAAKLLWTIGLFFLGGASGLKLHWELGWPSAGSSDQVAFVVADRRLNGLILILSVFFLFLLLVTVNVLPPFPGGLP